MKNIILEANCLCNAIVSSYRYSYLWIEPLDIIPQAMRLPSCEQTASNNTKSMRAIYFKIEL